MSNSGAAPTGCYKCGRPGHWSRDCPSSAPYSAGSPNPNSSYGLYSSKPSSVNAGGGGSKPAGKSSEKPKKVPRTRPKLTPQLLLSDDGLGYVLRHFPRAFKYRGLGHEVADLGNLISLYFEWHSHVLPYYSFDQFVRKVEQVGTTRHVKMCIRELRERVANGGDPTKLRETPVEHQDPNSEQGLSAPAEAMNSEEPSCVLGDLSSKDHDAVDLEDYMLQEIYKKDTEETSQAPKNSTVVASIVYEGNSGKGLPKSGGSPSILIQATDEQKARMEANKLKALERAKARGHSLQAA